MVFFIELGVLIWDCAGRFASGAVLGPEQSERHVGFCKLLVYVLIIRHHPPFLSSPIRIQNKLKVPVGQRVRHGPGQSPLLDKLPDFGDSVPGTANAGSN